MTSLDTQLHVLVTFARAWLGERRKAQGPEAGMATAEWVILIGVVVGMAVAIGGIILSKVTSKANSIPGL